MRPRISECSSSTPNNLGRLSRTTQAEPVIEGRGAHKPFMPYAPASHTYNGLNQRVLRENPQGQTVYVYGSEGHNVLGEYQPAASTAIRWSNGFNTEHIYLPTASGPMPIATVINGEHFAVHADHLNTPRRLTDRNGISRWQWAYSGFGEVGPQSLSTATLPEVRFNLRFPGQVDDANGLFYNWNRFYHPGTGRYTKSDPIGLDGGWNRFGYVRGNPLRYTDSLGLCPLCLIPALPGFGELAVVGAAWWASQNTFQTKTPNRGDPGEWHTNPGSGQERLYGPDRRPAVDIDWDHDHGQGQPHPHNWGPDGREVPEGGFSPWPRDRKNPAQCSQ